MSREIVTKAAGVIPPRVGNVFVRAASTSASSIDLSAYPGYFVTVQADGVGVYILSDAVQATAEALDPTAVSGNAQCTKVENGASTGFILADTDNFLGFKTSSSSGTIRVHVSSTRNGS
jgi:hypothetical protein